MIRYLTIVMTTGLSLTATMAFAQDGDPAKGKTIFNKCAVCHGIDATKKPVGPNLNGVIGRTAGTLEEFAAKYSKAMKEAGAGGLVWTPETIAEYITDPKKKVPGNKMAFPGLKEAQDRADVIAYIAQFSKPAQ